MLPRRSALRYLSHAFSALNDDDGLTATRVAGESLADLELNVVTQFLYSAGRVLDVGCGHGRLGRYLGPKGFEVVGVELDPTTAREAKRKNNAESDQSEFIIADGRRLSFHDQSFDFVISLASTLSEKHRIWLTRKDRASIVEEAVRVAKPGGLILVNFVHRYWNLKSLFSFQRFYWMWLSEKCRRRRTELGDYVEIIGRTPVRFHAFTIREAKALFPDGLRLEVWRRGSGLFTDWFFVVARKI